MRLLTPSFEILEQKDYTLKGIKKFIERCARVSYKSEDKITDESYEKFVNMLINRQHYRPLEFGTVYLNFNKLDLSDDKQRLIYQEMENKYSHNHWSRFINGFCTTNFRVIVENNWYDDLKYIEDKPKATHPFEPRYTVHFIIDRGVMDEFRTHIGLSHVAESTRYCNYSKDKHDKQISFIIPEYAMDLFSWGQTDELNETVIQKLHENGRPTTKLKPLTNELLGGLLNSEQTYLNMLKEGATPQQARAILPLQIKSELISCGYADAWENFFKLRTDNAAHPEARRIAIPLKNEFLNRNWIEQSFID